MKDKLPIYNALISDENEGIFVISLVDAPATETNWMCFKEQENIKFSIVNEDEHIFAGVVMVADKPIYRIAPFREPSPSFPRNQEPMGRNPHPFPRS